MKKEFKGFMYGVVLTGLLSCSVGATGVWDNISVLRNDINVVVNGENVSADNFLYQDTTYLPLRAVSTALGQSVEYDEITNTAYIGERKGGETMIKSKYTPTEPVDGVIICFENGIYYILVADIIDSAEEKGLQTNVSDLMEQQSGQLVIDGHSWQIVTLSENYMYIPYDTYVDEIEPLLK